MKGVAVLTGPSTYLDHLGVLSSILEIPLLVTEEETFLAAKKFYPQACVTLKLPGEISHEFLASHFDTVFQSGRFFASELKPLLDLLYKRKLRIVFCPHGNSHKGHSFTSHPQQDISLVYGQHMEDLLKATGATKSISALITTGNYRLPFYQKHRFFYDSLALETIGPFLDKKKQTILYAPSWEDGENSSSFFQEAEKLFAELQNYNVIVKLHPFLEKFHPAKTHQIIEKYKKTKGLFFLSSFPSIYPLLSLCNIYFGDYSSIGYDALAFDLPLYFLRKSSLALDPIEKAGILIPSGKCVGKFIEDTLQEDKHKERKQVYEYAFGKDLSLEEVKANLLKGLLNADPRALR